LIFRLNIIDERAGSIENKNGGDCWLEWWMDFIGSMLFRFLQISFLQLSLQPSSFPFWAWFLPLP
jgi:hypothetical protein